MTVQSGELLNIPDVYGHPLFNDKFDRLTGFKTRSLLSCAIPDSAGKTVAVLQVWPCVWKAVTLIGKG